VVQDAPEPPALAFDEPAMLELPAFEAPPDALLPDAPARAVVEPPLAVSEPPLVELAPALPALALDPPALSPTSLGLVPHAADSAAMPRGSNQTNREGAKAT